MHAVRYKFEDSTIVNTWAEAQELKDTKGVYEVIYVAEEPESIGMIPAEQTTSIGYAQHKSRTLPKTHSRN